MGKAAAAFAAAVSPSPLNRETALQDFSVVARRRSQMTLIGFASDAAVVRCKISVRPSLLRSLPQFGAASFSTIFRSRSNTLAGTHTPARTDRFCLASHWSTYNGPFLVLQHKRRLPSRPFPVLPTRMTCDIQSTLTESGCGGRLPPRCLVLGKGRIWLTGRAIDR